MHCSINSCMRPLAALDGMAVTTTEHCGNTREGVSPVQWQIAAQNGSQCGYCTAGMIMSAVELLERNPHPTAAQVRQGLEGNIRRCTGYHNIVKSVLAAAEAMGG